MTSFNDFFANGFDAVAVSEEHGEYTKLPEGNYKVYVEGFSIVDRPEKNQAGVMYNYVVMGGAYEGHNIRDQFLFKQDNEKGIAASMNGFAQLSLACGFERPNSFDPMVGKTIMVEMKASKDGKYVNPVKRFAVSNAAGVTTQAQATQSPATSESGAKKMPWAK